MIDGAVWFPLIRLLEVGMNTRLLCLAICGWLLATPAAAIVIVQDGDVYDELEVIDPEFLMTGGSINHLILGGITNAVIEGGVIGAENDDEAVRMLGSDHLTIRGGSVRRLKSHLSGIVASEFGNPVLTFEGFYFRLRDSGRAEGNQWLIQGWLTDGSFVHVTYFHELRASAATVEFNFTPGEVPVIPGDTNGDQIVNVNDLNNVRNNFDGTGLGDANADGVVDIEDLNLVRNNFGTGPFFTLGPEYEVPRPAAVPEPSTLALIALSTVLAIGRSYLG
jgi:hypothetical protein